MEEQTILQRLRTLKPWLAGEGLTRLRLFGSRARDAAHADSDVDLLVDLDRPMGLRFFELQDELSRRLGVQVDLVTEAGLAPDVRLSALRDAIDI